MKNLKLTMDLLPRGAWGNNLSKTLPKKEWDLLRQSAYERAGNKCVCCGSDGELDAHEVWDFDIPTKTQTLTDIVALCEKCHGVNHFRHSVMIGYGEHAKQHFLKINKCNMETFAAHFIEAENLFNERNKVDKWTMKVPYFES